MLHLRWFGLTSFGSIQPDLTEVNVIIQQWLKIFICYFCTGFICPYFENLLKPTKLLSTIYYLLKPLFALLHFICNKYE